MSKATLPFCHKLKRIYSKVSGTNLHNFAMFAYHKHLKHIQIPFFEFKVPLIKKKFQNSYMLTLKSISFSLQQEIQLTSSTTKAMKLQTESNTGNKGT